jgi:hypothetical protein
MRREFQLERIAVTREEAKQALLGYRPGINDPAPEVAEALEAARRDPQLNAWLAEQVQWHETVRNALRSVEPPPGLQQGILLQRVVVPLRPRWGFALAAAAVLAALLVVSALWLRPPVEQISFEAFRDRMTGFALREYRMDILTKEREEVLEYLARRGAPADFALPSGLDAVSTLGGARLAWQGNPVAMVCFELNEREILYFFVMEETAVKQGNLPPPVPEFERVKGLMTASWRSEGRIYLVAAQASEAEMRQLIEKRMAFLDF